MSLINDVLRDLDRHIGPAGHGRVDGVRGGSPARQASRRGVWTLLIIVLLVLAGLVAGWFLLVEREMTELSAARTVPAADQVPVPELQFESESRNGPELVPVPPVLLTTANLSEQNAGQHRLELIFDGHVAHRMEEDEQQLHLLLPGVRLDTEWPDLVSRIPALANADIRQQEEGMELVLRFDALVHAQAVMNRTAEGAVFHLDFEQTKAPEPRISPEEGASAPSVVASEATSSSVSADDKPARPTPVDAVNKTSSSVEMIRSPLTDRGDPRARRLYRQAVDELESNRREDGIRSLNQALRLDADLHPARELLANVLTAEGRIVEAMDILERGLERAPEHMVFPMRMARLNVRQGNPEAAVDVLERGLPISVGDGHYHALLAGLYQQTGQAVEAAGMYRELVRSHPDQAIWWLGLGLSLEDGNQPGRAAAAYRRARNVGGLEAELAVFVRDRLERLGN